MARPLKRRLGVLPYAAGLVSRLELPRVHYFGDLLVRLTGTFTVAGGATNGTLNDEEPQSLLRSIRVIRNGAEVLQDADGGTLFTLAQFSTSTPPQRTAIGSAAIGAYNFVVDIPIHFKELGLWTPSITLLQAVGTASLVLEVTWGTEANLVTGGDRTETLSATQVEVFGTEIMDVSGPFSDKRVIVTERQITATTPDFQFQLPTGPNYRRLLFKATDSDDFNLSNVVLNDIRVVADGTLYLADRLTWFAMRGQNKQNYGIEAMPDGYAVLDFCEDGNPQGMLVTGGAANFDVLCNVTLGTGVTRLRIVQESVTPNRLAA